GRIDAVDAAGGEQVARLDVGIGGHVAQLEPPDAMGAGVAIGDAADPGAGVDDGDGLFAVGHQRHFADQRVHPGDLAQHARLVDHRRAGFDLVHQALVDDDAPGVRVGRV